MKATTEPPITSGQMKWLSDEELDHELAIAALNVRRPERFELLLGERDRRLAQRAQPRRRLHLPHRH
jgi:hypothetical protein